MSIRPATVADARAIAEVHVHSWQWAYRSLIPDDYLDHLSIERRAEMHVQRLTTQTTERTWVAEQEGQIVGFAITGPSRDPDASPRTAELMAIYLRHEATGQGIAHRLFAHAVHDLWQSGYEHATLWVLESNARARRFYEKAGWVTDGTTKTEVRTGAQFHEVRYGTSRRTERTQDQESTRPEHPVSEAASSLHELVLATIRLYVSPDASRCEIVSVPMEPGMSGATVAQHYVTFDSPGSGSGTVSLVTKQVTLLERRVLALLQTQGQPGVPFSHTVDLETETPELVCLQDVGTQYRPTSLEPIEPELVRAEATVLAQVHHANAGASPPDWLPRVDRQYVRTHLSDFWEPAWTRAVNDGAFRREFGSSIAAVEATAARVADEIERLADDRRQLSLLHGDLNPSNVLIAEGSPWIVDWQAACYGPFYLDLPQHFHTLALAEEYRRARAELGDTFSEAHFAAGFRSAAHYIGLRSIWWTLDLWQEDRTQARWVWHYLNLITG